MSLFVARGIIFTYALVVTCGFLFGTSLIVAGIGVLPLREWARVMWLDLVPALVVVHLGIIVVNEAFRGGVSTYYLFLDLGLSERYRGGA